MQSFGSFQKINRQAIECSAQKNYIAGLKPTIGFFDQLLWI
jgi:hypothetical protein